MDLERATDERTGENGTSRAELPRCCPRREEGLMGKTEESASWVVYRVTIHGKPTGINAVCEQAEWDAMERDRPGHHTLVQAGITNEGVAESLARSALANGAAGKPPELDTL